MSITEQNVMDAIMKYVTSKGGAKSLWYVGLAKDPKKTMFKEHNVAEHGSPWFYNFAADPQEALRIYDKLMMMGFDGARLPKDPNVTGIFVFKKTGKTL